MSIEQTEITITVENFDEEVLRSGIPVLLEFWAPWCGSCRMMAPLLAKLSVDYETRIKIGKVNVAEQGDLASKHEIASLPALVLYQSGIVVNKKTGAVSKRDIENLIKDLV
ncbi:thioredoxin [Breznakiellaceae bacterium SP9]